MLTDLMAKTGEFEPDEQARRARVVCKIPESREQCLKELPEVQATRKKEKTCKDRLPR